MTPPSDFIPGSAPKPCDGSFRRRVQTIYLTDKAKLAEPEWQLLLSEPGLEFECPCGLRVESYLEPHKRGRNVRARRGEHELHDEQCPVVGGEFALEAIGTGQVVYTDSLFLESSPRGTARPVRRAGDLGGDCWYGDFGHLMNQGFGSASLTALAEVNRYSIRVAGPIRRPTTRDISRWIADFLNSPRMKDGVSPTESARRVGARIYWGVCSKLLVHRLHAMRYNPSDETLRLEEAWTPEGPVTTPSAMRVGYTIASNLRGKVWEYNRLIPPPYLVFAAVNAHGDVLQLLIIPICGGQNDKGWFSKESNAEDKFIRRILGSAAPVGLAKLGVQVDLGLLGPLWPHRLKANGHLPCRPDLIVLGRRGTAIYQVEGSQDRFYQAGVRRSLVALREFLRDPKILIRGVTLREAESGEPRFLAEIASIA